MVQISKTTPGSFKKPEISKPEPKEEILTNEESIESETESEQTVEEKTEDLFNKLGIKFTEDDFTKLLFNGSFEAVLSVRPGLDVKIRTLQASDFNEVDEKLANMTKDIAMTDEGYRARFTLLVLSYGLIQINKKDVFKIPTTGKKNNQHNLN